MSKFIFILFFLVPLNSFLQVKMDFSKNAVLLRGKVFYGGFIEDNYFRNLSIGAEFRFLPKHSVGIDFVHCRFRFETDSTAKGVEYYSGPNTYSRRNYINVDYRFYPFKQLMTAQRIDPYLNIFIKRGQRDVWTEDSTILYSMGKENIQFQNSNFSDYGLAMGLRLRFGSRDRFGLDYNVGAVRRVSTIWYEKGKTYSPTVPYEKFNVQEYRWALHMRLNLYFKILSFGDK